MSVSFEDRAYEQILSSIKYILHTNIYLQLTEVPLYIRIVGVWNKGVEMVTLV